MNHGSPELLEISAVWIIATLRLLKGIRHTKAQGWVH
jgi:hypothetical protein